MPDGQHDDPHASLGLLLLLGDRLRTVLAARCGLTSVESTALSHLAMSGPLTQRHLGDRVGLSTGAVTGLVDRLERHGVCRREPHPTDRRSSYVTLTAHGEEVLADATGDLLAAVDVVPAQRRLALAADLRAIAGTMAERVSARPRPTTVTSATSVNRREMSQQVAAS